MDPILEGLVHDRFGRWPDHQRLFEFFSSRMGHDRHLWSKPFDMVGLAGKEALRNKKREVGILHTCFLESGVQDRLNAFPNGVPVRLDNHAALDRGMLRHVCGRDNIQIPLVVIFRARREMFFVHSIYSVAGNWFFFQAKGKNSS